MPRGSMTRRYRRVVQVRTSLSISPMRLSQPAGGPGCIGRRGMRSPVTASMRRPSPRAMTRVMPMKEEERDADDQDRKPCRKRQPRDHDGEVEDPGGEREQHIKERGVGARIEVHAEEALPAAGADGGG